MQEKERKHQADKYPQRDFPRMHKVVDGISWSFLETHFQYPKHVSERYRIAAGTPDDSLAMRPVPSPWRQSLPLCRIRRKADPRLLKSM